MTESVAISTGKLTTVKHASRRHTVGVELVTPELRRQTYIMGNPTWAAVERYEGRLVKVCGTAEDPADLVT
uniref:hypothetical protein n=1 Tax=Sphaerisporangium fuscum TaxID=2835868 RepID=UPI001BDD5FAF